MPIHPELAYYYRPMRSTAWIIVIFGVLMAVMLFAGLEEFDHLGAYLRGRERQPGIMWAPVMFIALHLVVAGLVLRVGTRPLRVAAQVLATATPLTVAITVRYERRAPEPTITRWYVDFGPGGETAGLPASIRIAPPPGSEYRFRDLQEEAQVYDGGAPDRLIIRTSHGVLLARRQQDAGYP